MSCKVNLSFYGVFVQFHSDQEQLVEHIRRDFSFFEFQETRPGLVLNAFFKEPPYGTLPPMQARYISPRNTCYYHQDLKYINYSGEALVVHDRKRAVCDIYSRHHDHLHEICYMAILSLVTEQLDKRGIHRVHALGLALDGQAILILLDSGGGKTSLTMEILSSDNRLKLISEDSPLIDSAGQILPFPLRLGLHPEDTPSHVPPRYQRVFKTKEFDPKILIDIDFFSSRIEKSSIQPYIVMIGRRVIGKKGGIRPVSKFQAFDEFFKNSIIGVGLYQGIEYIFQNGAMDIVKKVPLGFSRLKNTLKVLEKSKSFEFLLGLDKTENSKLLLDFLGAR